MFPACCGLSSYLFPIFIEDSVLKKRRVYLLEEDQVFKVWCNPMIFNGIFSQNID